MSKYKKIQREKLSGKSLEIYDKLKKASNNFENTEGKIGEALDKFYNKVEKTAVEVEKKAEPKKAAPKKSTAKKSTPKKTTKKKTTKKKTASKKPSYKNVNQGRYAKLASKIMKEKGISYREAQKEASKIFAEEKKAKREAKAKAFSKGVTAFKKKYKGKGTGNTDIEKDASIPAKPVGKRVSKRGKVYYEYRDNRTDQKQPQPSDYPRLAKGGSVSEKKFKKEYQGNDGIVWVTGETKKGVTKFTPHYKGYVIDSAYPFANEKQLKDFIEDYIISNQKYNELRYKEPKQISMAKGGTIMSADIKEKIFDENGERKIDKKSIEILTDYVNSLEQTKSANQKDGEYTPSRKKLHGKIIERFKDGVVCIDNNKPIAILMGGSPASGKSTFLKKYAPYLLKDEVLRIDADEVRAMLPEYEGWNASQTHLETKDIVNTLLSDRTIGLPCETDIIYDGTMNSNKSYLPLIKLLRKMDYKIFVVYIDKVPKDVIVDRALNRYKSSGRFVPLEVIDDFFDKGKSALNEIKKKVDGYMIVDGSGGNYKVIEEGGIKLPKTRKYGKIGSPMKKKMEFGGDIAESYDVRPPYGTYAKGGEVDEYVVIHTSMNPESFIKKHKLSNYEYEIDESDYEDFTRINFLTYPKSQNFLKDKSVVEFYYEPYEEYAKGGKMKRDWSNYYNDGGMVEGYDVRSPYGTYAKGGEVFFHDTKSNKLQDWERRKSKSGKKSFGAFAHRMNNKYIGDYYLYELDDFDKKMYSNIKLKDGEMLVRVETDNMVGGESPLVKINLKNGRVYFMSDSSDDKNPKFDRASADVIFISVDKSMDKFAEGGTLPIGYHRMPDGEIAELKSVGSMLDVENAIIYPQLASGKADMSSPMSLTEDDVSSEWYDSLSKKDELMVNKSISLSKKRMAKGGKVDEYIVIHTSMNPESFIKKHKLSNYEYEIDESDYEDFTRINFLTYPKSQNFLKDKSVVEFYYEPYEEYAKGGKLPSDLQEFTLTSKGSVSSKGQAQEFAKDIVMATTDLPMLKKMVYFATAEDTNRGDASNIKSVTVRVFAAKEDSVSINKLADLYNFKISSSKKAKIKDGKLVYAEGGTLPIGYHRMPDGEIMADSEHFAKGGYVCMNCGEYAMGGKVKTTKRKKRKR